MVALAANYACGALNPRGSTRSVSARASWRRYDGNGVVRGTLGLTTLLAKNVGNASWPAGRVALIGMLNPLQTESAMRAIQRAKSLAGPFYLRTFCCPIRSSASSRTIS